MVSKGPSFNPDNNQDQLSKPTESPKKREKKNVIGETHDSITTLMQNIGKELRPDRDIEDDFNAEEALTAAVKSSDRLATYQADTERAQKSVADLGLNGYLKQLSDDPQISRLGFSNSQYA